MIIGVWIMEKRMGRRLVAQIKGGRETQRFLPTILLKSHYVLRFLLYKTHFKSKQLSFLKRPASFLVTSLNYKLNLNILDIINVKPMLFANSLQWNLSNIPHVSEKRNSLTLTIKSSLSLNSWMSQRLADKTKFLKDSYWITTGNGEQKYGCRKIKRALNA